MSKPGQRGDVGSSKRRRSLDARSKWTPLAVEAEGNEGAGHSWMGLSPPQHCCLLQHAAGNRGQLLKPTIYTKHGICIIWHGYFVSSKYLLNVD